MDADAKNSNRSGHPVEAALIDQADAPIYLTIADRAKHLRELGMSDRRIAHALGVSDKTAAKAAGGARTLAPGATHIRKADRD